MTDLGTIYKLNIHIDGLPGTMDDVSFTAVFFCADGISTPGAILFNLMGFITDWIGTGIAAGMEAWEIDVKRHPGRTKERGIYARHRNQDSMKAEGCITARTARVGGGLEITSCRQDGDLRFAATRIGGGVGISTSLVCTVDPSKKVLKIEPEFIWLTESNGYSEIVNVLSNTDWNLK